MKRFALINLGILAGLSTLAWNWRSPSPAPVETQAAVVEQARGVANDQTSTPGPAVELATAEPQPTAGPETQATATPAERQDLPPANAWLAQQQFDPQALKALREQRRRELAARYEAQLLQEAVDPQWQAELTNQVNNAVALVPNLQGINVTSTTCGHSLCKMSVSAMDQQTLRRLRLMSAGIGGLLGSDAWAYSDSVNLTSDIYVSRPGKPLPKLN